MSPSSLWTASFNHTNPDYDAEVIKFQACNAIGIKVADPYFDEAPITFIANIILLRKGTKVPANGADYFTPFQLIGLDNDRDLPEEQLHHKFPSYVGLDFADSVISRFDLSCCRFAIESPHEPGLVQALQFENIKLFCDLMFTYDMRKFTSNKVFKTRVSKYVSKGFTLAGITLGSHILNFENATFMDIRDYRANSASYYDTDDTTDSGSVSLILPVN